MGDPESRPQPSGLVPEQAAAYAVSFLESQSVDDVRWSKAEQRTAELIARIKGTHSSEERRKNVADYVGDLIRKCFDCQVYTFGSVPLKTYLPDGDIDLTIVSRDPRLKDTWANSVRSTLEKAERDQDGKFRVKEVQYINAEVKLIKCHVENIVVDISFNQFGGLCTLCFLEEVDLVIGRDHFFKRSIILVKAWCYYESVILGAHHGLISTYALETLVLYIFHVFHSSLRGPLEVLLRFLEFFSKFDWHKYAVSVWGPVPLLSLPEMTVESPRKDGGKLLLSKHFLDACLKEYAVFLTGQDNSQGRAFTAKYLNVVDPLRAGNNLGRSVNQTNFNRIAKVLGHSADKLLKILLDPSTDIDENFEDKKAGFFKRTKDRLDRFEEKRPDADDGIVQSATIVSAGSCHQSHQNGSTRRQSDENDDMRHSCGSETYFVEHNLQKLPEGWTLELDSRIQSSNHPAEKSSNQGSDCHLSATSFTGSDATFCLRASHEPNNGVSVAGGSNGSSASASKCSYVRHSTKKGSFPGSEAIQKPTELSAKTSMDSMGAITEKISKAVSELGARDYIGSSTKSMEHRDMESSIEDCTSKASVTNNNSYTQTNFENNWALVGSRESHSLESLQGSANFPTEVSCDGPIPVRGNSPNNSTDKEGARCFGWAGDQTLYVTTNGALDGQGYVQHRGQDSAIRGPIPVPVSVMPHAQIPVTLSHPGQPPMHLATSMPVSSSKGHLSVTLTCHTTPLGMNSVNGSHSSIIGDSPLGLGPRSGPYYTRQLPRGPPVPPLPPGFFHGPPLAHHLPPTMGEFPKSVSRLSTSYPVQQGEDKSFEQRQVCQQMEQMQLHDHQHKYGHLRSVSTISTAVSPMPQHLNSDNSFVISSAPALVTSGPFHLPASLSVPETQATHNPAGNPRPAYNGSCTDMDSFGNTAVGQEVLKDVQVDETGKSLQDEREMGSLMMISSKLSSQVGLEAGTRSNKNSKPSKEKRIPNKSKGSSNEDAVDVGAHEDGMPSLSAERSGHGPTQGITDDTVPIGLGYPQLLPVTGPALGPSVYSHLLSSSLHPYGPGSNISELSSHPPRMVPTPRTSAGHSSISSQPSSQMPSLPISIPSGPSNSPHLPVTELVNGSSNLPTTQQQRTMESAPVPQSFYYPTGSHYPLLSMYNTANTNQVYMLSQSPDPTVMGMDLFGGLLSCNSLESYNDTGASLGEDLRLRLIQQGRLGVGERLRAAGVATSSISRLEASATETQDYDALDPHFYSDLLSGDFGNHRRNLGYARWCQNSHMPVQMTYAQQQYLAPSTKYYPDYRPWEGPGRPSTPNVKMLGNVISYGLVQGPPSVSTSMRVGNFPRPVVGPGGYIGEELPKSLGGTGTYLPSPRPPYIRDRQSSGSGRTQHGGHSQERGDRVDREVNPMHGPRFRGSGRGQSKYEPRSQTNNVSFERNNVDTKVGERGRDVNRQHEGLRRNQVQSGPASLGVSPVTCMSHVTVTTGVPAEMCSVPIMTGNDKSSTPPGTVGGTLPAVVVIPLEKRTTTVADPLEFGSLGPVQIGASHGGSDVDHGAGHVSSLQTHEQVNAYGLPGFSSSPLLASGDRNLQGPSSPTQRVMQRAYQLKDEDFPPLSFRGQHGSSSSGSNSSNSTTSQSSSYSGYVIVPSW